MNLLKTTIRSINPKSSRGFSLVELMVAITVSLILLNGVMQIFTGSKENYAIQEELSRLQENGRFAMDVLTREMRMAGYLGCSSNAQIANSIDAGSGLYDLSTPITGFEGGVDPVTDYGTTRYTDTDSFVIRFLNDNNAIVVTSHNPSSAVIHLAGTHALEKGEIYIIADSNCTQIGIFQMSGPNSGDVNHISHNKGGSISPGNCLKALKGNFDCDNQAAAVAAAYSAGSTVVRLSAHEYYIGYYANAPGKSVPVLFRKDLSSAESPEEMIEGVEDLQILYGVDTNTDNAANQYDTANAVASWQNVVSVRIALLLRTTREVASKPQAYTFQGVTHSSHTDGYLRREFTTTIQIRNKGLS